MTEYYVELTFLRRRDWSVCDLCASSYEKTWEDACGMMQIFQAAAEIMCRLHGVDLVWDYHVTITKESH